MNTYKITIECTSLLDLCYENTSIEKLIAKFDYIKKAILLHKTYMNKHNKHEEKKISLEFICKGANIISETQFKTFIETMRSSGFYSMNDKTICLIKINASYEIIYEYKFQSLTKQKIEERNKENKSNYHTQILYTTTLKLSGPVTPPPKLLCKNKINK